MPKRFFVEALIFGLLAFIALSIFGQGHALAMEVHGQEEMNGCIFTFTGEGMICKMSIIEHISIWKSLFTATVQRINASFLAFIFSLLASIIFWYRKFLKLVEKTLPAHGYTFHDHSSLQLFDPIKIALGRGILQRKVFEPALV